MKLCLKKLDIIEQSKQIQKLTKFQSGLLAGSIVSMEINFKNHPDDETTSAYLDSDTIDRLTSEELKKFRQSLEPFADFIQDQISTKAKTLQAEINKLV